MLSLQVSFIQQLTKNVSNFSADHRLLQTLSDLRFSQYENLEHGCLGYDTIPSGSLVAVFWSNLLIVLSVADKSTFTVPVTIYHATLWHKPEDHSLNVTHTQIATAHLHCLSQIQMQLLRGTYRVQKIISRTFTFPYYGVKIS
jgi:hypothetical protein